MSATEGAPRLGGMDITQIDWVYRPPSRRLRKLYKELANVDARIKATRASNPCPEHAPTACRLMRAALKELHDEWTTIVHRIALLQNDDEEGA